MDTIKSNIDIFSNIKAVDIKHRQHIDELNGLFWLKNNTGVELKYWLITKKKKKNDTSSLISKPILVNNLDY